MFQSSKVSKWSLRRHVEGVLWLTVLTSFVLSAMTSAKVPLIVLGILGIGAAMVVVPLYFWRAWRRSAAVANRGEYVAWVSFETLFACSFVLAVIYAIRG